MPRFTTLDLSLGACIYKGSKLDHPNGDAGRFHFGPKTQIGHWANDGARLANKEIYTCLKCGVGGDAIRFVMDFKKLDFIDAVEAVIRILNNK